MGCESSSPSNSQPPREAAIRLCIQRLHLVIVANHSSRSAKAFDDACCTELHNIISLAERYPMGHLFTEIYSEIVQLRREHPDNLMSDNLRFLICMTLKVFNPENTTTYSIHEDKPFQVEPQVVSTVCKEESVAEDDLMATADAEDESTESSNAGSRIYLVESSEVRLKRMILYSCDSSLHGGSDYGFFDEMEDFSL